ncbi:MAG: ABC transporter ATP-binding protein, partial [Ferrimonas sp.]
MLRHINLHVEAGQMVAILGPNGVGKTTLLRCLYRHFSPTEGAIYYGQQALATLPRRQLAQHLAVVLQHQPMAFSLTVEELLSSGLLAHKRWWQW